MSWGSYLLTWGSYLQGTLEIVRKALLFHTSAITLIFMGTSIALYGSLSVALSFDAAFDAAPKCMM